MLASQLHHSGQRSTSASRDCCLQLWLSAKHRDNPHQLLAWRVTFITFVRVFIYALPFWLGSFELTVHQAFKEKDPEAFLAPGLMLSAIALLTSLCLARKEPAVTAGAAEKFRYRCDVTLVAMAAALALIGMPLWHQILGASLSGIYKGWLGLTLFGWSSTKSISVVYYFFAVSLSELKRLTT
ncbi:hypothetical protein [Caballeronia sp. HLA56]